MLTLSPARLSRSPLHVRRNYAGVLRGDVLVVRGCMIVWTDEEGSEQRRRWAPQQGFTARPGTRLIATQDGEYPPAGVLEVVESLAEGVRVRVGEELGDGAVTVMRVARHRRRYRSAAKQARFVDSDELALENE